MISATPCKAHGKCACYVRSVVVSAGWTRVIRGMSFLQHKTVSEKNIWVRAHWARYHFRSSQGRASVQAISDTLWSLPTEPARADLARPAMGTLLLAPWQQLVPSTSAASD